MTSTYRFPGGTVAVTDAAENLIRNHNEGSSMSVTELSTRERLDKIHEGDGTGSETVPSAGLESSPAFSRPQQTGEAPGSEPDLPPLDEITLKGTAQLSIFDMGGKIPDSSSLKFTGGKVALADATAFKKGETVVVRVVAVVNSVSQKDKHDAQTGQVVSCEQRHEARITDMVIEG